VSEFRHRASNRSRVRLCVAPRTDDRQTPPSDAEKHLFAFNQLGARLADKIASTHVEVQRLAGRDAGAVDRLLRAFGEDPICVPDRDADVHDIASLVDLHNDLFAA
jgi:hypothetical protein